MAMPLGCDKGSYKQWGEASGGSPPEQILEISHEKLPQSSKKNYNPPHLVKKNYSPTLISQPPIPVINDRSLIQTHPVSVTSCSDSHSLGTHSRLCKGPHAFHRNDHMNHCMIILSCRMEWCF